MKDKAEEETWRVLRLHREVCGSTETAVYLLFLSRLSQKSTRQSKEDCPRKLASGASVALLCRYWCCMLRLQLIMQSTQSDYLSAYLTRCTPITILRYSIHPQTMFPHISAKQAEILLLLSVCKGTATFSLSPNTPWLKLRSSA